MARRALRGSTHGEDRSAGRKGGGFLAGIVIGLTVGVVLSAGLAWYLNMMPSNLKPVDAAPEVLPEPEATLAANDTVARPQPAVTKPEQPAVPMPPVAKPKTKPRSATRSESSPRPKVNYTFYGILPGNKPARPVEPPPSKDRWWLQIAALSDRHKAEQIRIRLSRLHLPASTQKIESNGQPLYRIRVGPYKREDDAFGDLDVLTENDFNARLLKDPVNPE
jgi:cell division protein FtsN